MGQNHKAFGGLDRQVLENKIETTVGRMRHKIAGSSDMKSRANVKNPFGLLWVKRLCEPDGSLQEDKVVC